MDPLSSLSAAASILSVIQFSGGLLKTVREICRSSTGLSEENTNIELSCLQLRQKAEGLAKFAKENIQSFPSGEDGEDLIRIADRCVDASRHILQSLDRVRYGEAKIESDELASKEGGDELQLGQKFQDAQRRRLRIFRKAMKAAWSEDETAKAAKTMSDLSRELELHILSILQKGQITSSVLADHRFGALRRDNKELVRTILENRDFFVEETRIQMDRIHEEHKSSLLELLSKLTERIPTDRENDATVNRALLRSLWFHAMYQRYEAVDVAHESTFDWIFQPELETILGGSSFPEWLRSGHHGLYWINGKAASGKSTLMRYIINNGQAHELLRAWSTRHDDGDDDLSIFTFFFWSGGTHKQRSLRGIFQTILYQHLSERPEHAKVIFPDEYDCRYRHVVRGGEEDRPSFRGWAMEDLQNGFERLINHMAESDRRLCLFVDGLDEYEGNHTEMAKFLFGIAAKEHVKVCVSSRPWHAFRNIFGECPSLTLQDRTKGDIEMYVTSRLAANESFTTLGKAEPEKARKLIDDVVKLANGVFLWVRLVLESLVQGLEKSDDFDDLAKRLQCLPRGLDDLYTHMLKTIDPPFYLEEAAMYFEILRTARHSQDLARLVVQTVEDDESSGGVMSLVALALADGKNIKRLNQDHSWTESVESRQDLLPLLCRQTESRLRSRCMGLIEVSLDRRGEPTQHSAVSYIHRTLVDFLEQSSVRALMMDAIKDRNFSPNLSLARSCLFHTRFTLQGATADPGIGVWRSIQLCVVYASLITEAEFTDDVVSLLDQLDSAMSSHFGKYDSSGFHWTTERVLRGGDQTYHDAKQEQKRGTFLSFCIEQGLFFYVESALNHGALPSQSSTLRGGELTTPSLLLHHAVCSLIADSGPTRMSRQNYVRICKALLDYGAAPNQAYRLRSPWEMVLSSILRNNPRPSDLTPTRARARDYPSNIWLDTALAFITRGADLTPPSPTRSLAQTYRWTQFRSSAPLSSPPMVLASLALGCWPNSSRDMKTPLKRCRYLFTLPKILPVVYIYSPSNSPGPISNKRIIP